MKILLGIVVAIFVLEGVHLKAPDLSKEKILGTHVGIRPCRKNGPRIEPEHAGSKLLIHNYGYGGSGLTLSFGGAQEVLAILRERGCPCKRVAILGAGVIGLTTAYDLLELGYDVTIYSAEWSPYLTSDVAAGVWTPLDLSENAPLEVKERNQRMLKVSEERFSKSLGKNPEFAGVRLIDSYSVKALDGEELSKSDDLGEEVILEFAPNVQKSGRKIVELAIDGQVFMADLFAKVQAKGAKCVEQRFLNREEIEALDERTIINCTSLGSRELFHDEDLFPVRGQLIYFEKQEGVDYLYYQKVPGEKKTWVMVYPWSDRLIIGGVYEEGIEEMIVCPQIIDALIENAKKSFRGEI